MRGFGSARVRNTHLYETNRTREARQTFLIQVRYRERVAAASPDGWVTVGAADDLRTAAREAARRCREANDHEGAHQVEVRIQSEDRLRIDGGPRAVADALSSLSQAAFGASERPATS